jgi:hypothetical protein
LRRGVSQLGAAGESEYQPGPVIACLDLDAIGQRSDDRKTETGSGRSGLRGYPGSLVDYLDNEAVGALDPGSHRDQAIVAAPEGVQDRVGDCLRDRELDVVAVRPPGRRVFGHPCSSLGDALWVTTDPQFERRQLVA